MTHRELEQLAQASRCHARGLDDAGNAGHRAVLAAVIRAFNCRETYVLCEPSLARKSKHPPDVVLIDPEIGVHVLEVKAMKLDDIERIDGGGQLHVRYPNGPRARNPVSQAKQAMFDIRDATERAFGTKLRTRFETWVVFPLIRRSAWMARFGPHAFCPPEFLFEDDLPPASLLERLGASEREHSTQTIHTCPLEELQCVWRAFGDNSVLYCSPEDRPARQAPPGTLGQQFDQLADADKALSDEQQRLSAMKWDGPRLIRGIAGSGKTIVLANNLARRLERMLVENRRSMCFTAPAARRAPPCRAGNSATLRRSSRKA